MTKPFSPDWVSCPGDTIQDVLDEYNASSKDLSKAIGITISDVDKLLVGALSIDDNLAERLATTVGGSKGFWLRRESNYRTHLNRIKQESDKN